MALAPHPSKSKRFSALSREWAGE